MQVHIIKKYNKSMFIKIIEKPEFSSCKNKIIDNVSLSKESKTKATNVKK